MDSFIDLDKKTSEIAEVLALGIRRLHERHALASQVSAVKLPKTPSQGLEVPAETVLSVHTG